MEAGHHGPAALRALATAVELGGDVLEALQSRGADAVAAELARAAAAKPTPKRRKGKPAEEHAAAAPPPSATQWVLATGGAALYAGG